MKKTAYLAPAITVTHVELQPLMDPSVTTISGNSGIDFGTGETPTTADSRRVDLWADDAEEE